MLDNLHANNILLRRPRASLFARIPLCVHIRFQLHTYNRVRVNKIVHRCPQGIHRSAAGLEASLMFSDHVRTNDLVHQRALPWVVVTWIA